VKSGNPFKQIRVQPAARLDRLETVIVLLSKAPVDFPNTDTQNTPTGAQNSAAAAPTAEKP
jgi:hypothetical protein